MDWLELVPFTSIKIKAPDITKCDSSITKSTMASIDVDLVVVDIVSTVSSRRWGTNRGFLIWFNILIAFYSCPGIILNVKPPAVIEPGSWVSMSTKYEELIALGSDTSDVLSTRSWDCLSFRLFFFPTDFL